MTKRSLLELLSRLSRLEYDSDSPAKVKYWAAHWARLHTLAVKRGWL